MIGGLAVNVYGLPRSTKDMDLFIEHEIGNCENLLCALEEVKLGTVSLTDAKKIFENEITIFDDVIRIDVLTQVKGLEFLPAWDARNEIHIDDVLIPFVSFEHLIQSKKAVGRKHDMEDVRYLLGIGRETGDDKK